MTNRTIWMSLALCASLTACGDDGGSANTSNATTGDNESSTTDASTPTTTAPSTSTPQTGSTTDGTSETDPTEADASSTNSAMTARVRVMHLGVNAPGVDVYANGQGPAFENLEFRNSTQYAEVDAGENTFEVTVSGAPVDEAVLAPTLPLDPETDYTAVAIGDLNETDGAPPLQAIALVDDRDDIAAQDVRITVVHAAPAVGQVDIWEVSDAENPTLLLENVDFAGVGPLPDIPAGPLEIGLDVNDDLVPDVFFSVDATGLAGMQANVYANNDSEGAVALIAQLADGTVLTIPANPV